jgi:hypothetical protein
MISSKKTNILFFIYKLNYFNKIEFLLIFKKPKTKHPPSLFTGNMILISLNFLILILRFQDNIYAVLVF